MIRFIYVYADQPWNQTSKRDGRIQGAANFFLNGLKVFRCGLTGATILGRLEAHLLAVA